MFIFFIIDWTPGLFIVDSFSQTTPLSLGRSPASQSGSGHARTGGTSTPSRSEDIQIERIRLLFSLLCLLSNSPLFVYLSLFSINFFALYFFSGYPAKETSTPAVPAVCHPPVSGRFGTNAKVVGMMGMGGGNIAASGDERKEETGLTKILTLLSW